jgi:fructokinase
LSAVRSKILCVGEYLADVLPSGLELPGGAPANVAFHAGASTAVEAEVVSRIGDDARGRELRARLRGAGIKDGLVQVDGARPTGTVQVRLDANGPGYEIGAPAAWDFLAESAENTTAAQASSVVVFGTLAQRHPVARQTIRSLVGQARASGALAVADLNLRAPFFDDEVIFWTLRHCDLLKLSREELLIVSGRLGADGEMSSLFEGLVREFGLRRAVLTCGGDGACFFDQGCTWRQSAVATELCDTVGAGDAMTAILSAALALGVPLREAAPLGAEVASFVVSQAGAMPHWPDKLVNRSLQVLPPAA